MSIVECNDEILTRGEQRLHVKVNDISNGALEKYV